LEEENVKIGLMAPLSGVASPYGTEIARAAAIACEEVNSDGGVLGLRLELVIEDDGSIPQSAVPAAERLLDHHGCAALIGNLLSNARIAVATRVADPRGIPLLNFSFYEGSILSRNFFHFAALPNQQISQMIPYMANQYGPKFYLAGANYEWPVGSIDAAKRKLHAIGGEVVGEEYFDLGTENFYPLLSRVERSGADVFVPYGAGKDQILLIRQFFDLGLKEKVTIITGHFDEVMASHLTPDEREGIYSCNTYFMSVATDANQHFLQHLARYPDVNGIWPGGNGIITNFGEGVYLCVKAFANAANQSQSLAPDMLISALERLELDGLQGRIAMDPDTHHAEVNCFIACCQRDGSFTIEKDLGTIKPSIPARYAANRHINLNHVFDPLHYVRKRWQFLGMSRIVPERDFLLHPSRMRAVKLGDFAYFLQRINEHLEQIGLDLSDPIVRQRDMFVFDVGDLRENYFGQVLLIRLEGMLKGRPNTYYAVFALKKIGNRDDLIAGQSEVFLDGRIGDRPSIADTAILNHADISIVTVNDAGIIVQANKRACLQFGYPADELLGLSVHHLLPPNLRATHIEHVNRFIYSSVVEQRAVMRSEIAGYRKDGSTFPAIATLSKFDLGGEVGVVVTLVDISDRKQVERDLEWRASHDPLTDLPNRNLLNERLENAIRRSAGFDKPEVAVLFVDLDDFKLVNDNYGHEVGDELLIAIARRFLSLVNPGVTVGRFGGDEFVIILDQVGCRTTAEALAEELVAAFEDPLELTNPDMYLYTSISIGISFGKGNILARELLSNADAAMYAAKDSGKNRWRVFDTDISDKNKLQINIANGLHRCRLDNELSLVYQPIIDLNTNEIVSTEALLRWTRDGEEIPPSLFIPIAEKNGLIAEIGNWVFEEACREQANRAANLTIDTTPTMSVNLSPRQLEQTQVVSHFKSIIESTGVDPRQIILEVTETSLMSDVSKTLGILNELTTLGLSLAVDDFGTGYSSLSQLQRMPVTSLKIDQAFVEEIDTNQDYQVITEAITKMAHTLGISVTAEGVETEAQLRVLRDLGCDYGQGYLFCRPQSGLKILPLLQGNHSGS